MKRSVTLQLRRPRADNGGFTLVELMIVVAMVGVLAAIGLLGYRRYIHSSQGSEAKAMIQGIKVGQEAYKAEFLTYLNASQGSFTRWYPHGPDDSRANWVQPTYSDYNDPTYGWALLNVNADGPVRFGYVCVAGVQGTNNIVAPPDITGAVTPTLPTGVPWYVVEAMNRHNAAAGGAYAVYASTSISGEIMAQNEQQ
jgi:type IV pilus assembly protein PilA